MSEQIRAILLTAILIAVIVMVVNLASSGVFDDPNNRIPSPKVLWTNQGAVMVYDETEFGELPYQK